MSAAPQQPWPPPAAGLRHPTSGTLALIMGILGLTVLPLAGAILALVFGYQCRREAEQHPTVYSDDYGRIGRILGWVGVALSALGLVMVLVVLALFLPLVA